MSEKEIHQALMEMLSGIATYDDDGWQWINEHRVKFINGLDEYKVKNTFNTITWYNQHMIHRDDGPAVKRHSGTMLWYKNGFIHRDNAPAIIYTDETENWFQFGQPHRDNGPAVVDSGGDCYWYKHGDLHRLDGPAVSYGKSKSKIYYIDGQHLTKNDFNKYRKEYNENT